MKKSDKKRTRKAHKTALLLMGGMMISAAAYGAWFQNCYASTSTSGCSSYSYAKSGSTTPCTITITPRASCGFGVWKCPSAAGTAITITYKNGTCTSSPDLGAYCVRWTSSTASGLAAC